jgi:pimeloyl-ACP methyl ester carboxylesterase
MPGFCHHYADVNDTRLHFVAGGRGPAILLVHGWPYTWLQWQKLMPLLADCGFTVIAPDLRGMGDSAPADKGFTKINVAEDIRLAVAELGIHEVNLVGSDIGTMVAYAYAASHPEEVRRLCLSESVLPGFGLEELMNPATGGYWHFGFHMQVELATMLTTGKEAAYLTPMWSMMSVAPDALEFAAANYLPYFASAGGMRGGFQHYGTLLQDGKDNQSNFQSKLTMPVLVLSAERGIPQNQTADSVQRACENIEIDIVPSSGHDFASDNPAWTAERLVRFFK